MKRLIGILSALTSSILALAQTPQEIIARMETEMEKHEGEGLIMTVDTKVPVVGSISIKSYTLGNKARIETELKGYKFIEWTDGVSDWEYDSKNKKIEITKANPSTMDDAGDAELFSEITDGYDVTLKKETDDAWYFVCKKTKDNTDKDAPKNIDLVVSKRNYYPVSLSAKMSGITLTMRNISFGVTEKQVTFNATDFPGITIIDKR
jgi:outer membrane lipoprotein-sorting protein